MRSLFFTPKPEDVPEEPVSDRQPEENRADNTPDKHKGPPDEKRSF